MDFPCDLSGGMEINYNINRTRGNHGTRRLGACAALPPAPPDISETGIHSADDFFEASGSITSDAVVPVGQDVKYRGGTEVTLGPGFHAEAGSDFHAFIHPCDGTGNSFTPKNLVTGPGSSNHDRDKEEQALSIFPNPAG
ncbi:MAG: hypothetical protein IPF64_14180 [Flavobacteriales bacterium]|nr:hypothetical protein [Flavobacteriales bacterium]